MVKPSRRGVRRVGEIMSGPLPRGIIVTARQRQVLEGIVRRASSPQQQVARAKIILVAAAGANNEQVGRRVGVSRETVRLWRDRWGERQEALVAAEVEGGDAAVGAVVRGVLADEPRPGAPARFSPEQFCQIMALACTPPAEAGRPLDHWTARELAAEAVQRGIVARISPSTVERFLGRGSAQAAPEPLLADAGPRRAAR